MKIGKCINIGIKLAELRTKVKNSPQLQVRNLNCLRLQVCMSATFFVSPHLRICRLTCRLAQLWKQASKSSYFAFSNFEFIACSG